MGEPASEEDLWFLPGPMAAERAWPPPDPEVEAGGAGASEDWRRAEAGCAAHLARVAGRLGALDDRLKRGPEGWRHRLALIEAAELSWCVGDRVGPDRLALWLALRLSGVQEDAGALARLGWAVRRLTGGPGPGADLAAFLDRRGGGGAVSAAVSATVSATGGDAEPLAARAQGWLAMAGGGDLHPITRACMGFHLWGPAGLGPQGDRMEAAVAAARIAVAEAGGSGAGGSGAGGPGTGGLGAGGTAAGGAVFAPLAMGGAGGLRPGGPPAERLGRWLDGMQTAIVTAMRHLDDIEAWGGRAERVMAPLSGRTPRALRRVLVDWPLVSAPMAEALTGASRAAVQRNLAWMEAHGLIREITGQGRFRMWRAQP